MGEKGQAGLVDNVVVYYRPLDQDKEVGEPFYRQLISASQLQVLVFMGDFSYPDICWKAHSASQSQSRMFLQCINDNFSGWKWWMNQLGEDSCWILFSLTERVMG